MKVINFFKPTQLKIIIITIIAITAVVVGYLGAPRLCEVDPCPQLPLNFLHPIFYGIPTLPAYIMFEGHYDLIQSVGWLFNVVFWYLFACVIDWLLSLRKKKMS